MKQMIISIGREYGSGGHEIAENLAKRFGLPFYDKNILYKIAAEKNVPHENMYKYDESPKRMPSRSVRGFNSSPEENLSLIHI